MLRYQITQGKYGETDVEVFHGDKLVFEWSDCEAESPEDLIWHRKISDIFEAGVRAGELSSRAAEGLGTIE